MAIDLVTEIERYLTPDIIRKIASTSGFSEPTAQHAARTAAPAILSALASMVTKPGGSQKLANAVADQPSGTLADLLSRAMGSEQTATQGNSLWSNLLGGSVVGLLASTLAKYLGVSEGPVRTLIGLLAPVVLGVLGNKQRAAKLDHSGLAQLLSGQKEQISEAMPQGLLDALEASGLYDSNVSTSSPSRTTTSVRPHTSASSQSNSWAYWVLPLLLLGGLFWYLLPDAHRTETADTPPPPKQTTQGSEKASVYLASVPEGWVSIGGRPNEYVNFDLYNHVGDKLGTIRDILIDTDGKMAAALVDVGQFLGIGEKQIAVPFTMLRVEPQHATRRIVIDATKTQLQLAPAVAPAMRQ